MAKSELVITRVFKAPRELVWKAWTEASVLDKWWAPKPWQAQTKNMNFSEGGQWLYCMAGPGGEKHWSRVDFKTIHPMQSFTTDAYFSDENGNIATTTAPVSHWAVEFHEADAATRIEVTLTFDNDADMQLLVSMGFEGGFTMALGNLDTLLQG